MSQDFYADLDDCIVSGFAHAMLVPWLKNSRKSLIAAHAGLTSRGWVWVESREHYERRGWYLWLRSQGELAAPIAQFAPLGAAPAAPAPLDAPHDYVTGRGDTCGVCGKSITHPLHQPELLAIPDQQTPLVLTSPDSPAPMPRASATDPRQFSLF